MPEKCISTRDVVMHFIQQKVLKACKLAGDCYAVLSQAISERFNINPKERHWCLYQFLAERESSLLGDDMLVANRFSYMTTNIQSTLGAIEAWKRYKIPLDNMLSDNKITWGRVIMMIVYTHVLAHSCFELGYLSRIAELIEWCADYMDKNGVEEWIKTNGGWEYILAQNKLGPCDNSQCDFPIQVAGGEVCTILASSGGMLKVMANRLHCMEEAEGDVM